MIAALLAVALIQAGTPTLEASVDEDRVSVGEELYYTLRAVSHSPVPMHVTVTPFNGLEIVARSERTEVSSTAGDPTRTTVLEVRLRAVRPGRWQIGPARAIQGRDTVEAAAVVVDVMANRAATASTLSPRLKRLLDQARPPSAGQAAVDLIVSADSVRVGEQVDVVTAAWFPRDLRLQLRRPPTLQPPVIDGVWSYPQSTPAGIAATRNIGGRWYDLFIAHQVVFPLLPGTVAIPRATLKYSTPVALQFFSQEERFALTSRADTLAVRALPETGRPADFTGAIGSGLRLDRRVTPVAARVGEGVAIELSLTGEGNTALWPTPEMHWAPGSRAYSDKVEERVGATEGRIGGTKTFRFLVVPDSVGALALPAVSYAYFDLAAQSYQRATLPAASVPVVPGGEATASTALPPPLLRGTNPSFAWWLSSGVPDWVWLVVLLAPPLALAAWNRRPAPRPRPAERPAGDLRSAEEELDAVVRSLVPDLHQRSGPGIAAAVRASGADSALAARVAAVRERLMSRRYGPEPGAPEDAALADRSARARPPAGRLTPRLGRAGRGADPAGGAPLVRRRARADAIARSPVRGRLAPRRRRGLRPPRRAGARGRVALVQPRRIVLPARRGRARAGRVAGGAPSRPAIERRDPGAPTHPATRCDLRPLELESPGESRGAAAARRGGVARRVDRLDHASPGPRAMADSAGVLRHLAAGRTGAQNLAARAGGGRRSAGDAARVTPRSGARR